MDLLLLLLLLLLIFVPSKSAAQQQNSTIRLGSSLNPQTNSYWSSDSGHFAFGFYPAADRFYVGIFMPNIPERTVVWTANRNDPPLSGNATLILDSDGRLLVLEAGEEISIANTPRLAASAAVLDSGNFVLYGSDSNIIWQTFDFPTDTILPAQRLKAGKDLVCRKSGEDYSRGRFGMRMRKNGNLVMYALDYPFKSDYFYWRLQTRAGDNVTLNLDSNGRLFLLSTSGFNLSTLNNDGRNISGGAICRATIDDDGIFRLYSHDLGKSSNWSVEWESSSNKCDPTGLCGLNSYCEIVDRNPVCNCLPNFDFIDPNRRDLGCQWKSAVNGCAAVQQWNITVDELENVAWETGGQYSSLPSSSKESCRDECFKDCNCEAAIFRKQQCNMLKLPLRLGKKQQDDPVTTFIKNNNGLLAAGNTAKSELKTVVVIVCIVFSIVASLVIITFGILFHKFRLWSYKKVSNQVNDELLEDVILRGFTYEELKAATNNFQDEIGRGGFGTVYKGWVSNGSRVVAIKRLQKVVSEGEREFRNEMKIIGRTHHKSLVRLYGYCHDETNRLLVYEYMKNGSLADFLFRHEPKPSWEERTEIALTIARGIVYLHEECETQIIHCDIKPENILMDENEYPKIADFGLSKLLMPDQSMTYTGIRGTRGYVAPEWHSNAPITAKVDVYSFGIMLLEIIFCRRNVEMSVPDDEVVLANWVYRCYEAKELERVIGGEEIEGSELERVVKVGLWCIQDNPGLRPVMKKVVLMLEGIIDTPVPPACPSFSSPSRQW